MTILSLFYAKLKKIICFLLIFTLQTHPQNISETIEISELTNQVHARYYFIQRLTKTIQSFYRLHTDCKIEIPQQIIDSLKKLRPFENQLIQNCCNEVIATKSLQPIFACWQNIITYKYIENSSLTIEFSQFIHTLIHKLVLHTKSPEILHLKQLSPDIDDSQISTHQVCFRFYLLKRLTHLPALFKLHHDDVLENLPKDLIFTHPRIVESYGIMQTSLSIQPVEKLFEEIEQYKFIDDTVFIHEFLRLAFITLTVIWQDQEAHPFMHSFEHVFSFSITELLEAIDIEIKNIDYLAQHTIKNIQLVIEEIFDYSPNSFANYIYRRYYFIQRLERIMGLFQEINRSINNHSHPPFIPETIFNFQNSFTFKHNKIKESINNMQHEQNLKPLFSVWNDFITYKSIEDQLYIEEFTKEIFVISRNILACTGICEHQLPLLRTTIGLPAHQLLDVIDMYIDQFLEQKPEYNSTNLATILIPIRMPDLHQTVHIDDVVFRYYHIQRLGVIFWLLNQIRAKSIPIHFSYTLDQEEIIINEKHHFSHEYIVSCIKVMEQTNSIEPLMGVMQGVQRYKFIDNEQFSREYLTLLLVTFEHLELKPQRIRAPLNQSSRYDDIPLERILDALDIIAQELPELLEKYEFNAPSTWKDWLKNHWWAPAIIVGSITFKILMMLNRSGFWAKHPEKNKLRPNLSVLEEDDEQEIIIRPRPRISKLLDID